MKTNLCLLLLLITLFSACQKKDISALKDKINILEGRLITMEAAMTAANADIKGLKQIADALQKNISVKSYVTTASGYMLTMSDGSTIELKNGSNGVNGINGKDGTNGTNGINAPVIGVKLDADGQYYWTLGGDFILQNGQKLRVTGDNGSNGTNGTDGVTPLLQVNSETNQWVISYDNGNTWAVVKDKNGNPVPATGAQGGKGDTGAQGPQGPAGVPGFTIVDGGETITITYNSATYTLSKTGTDPNTFKIVLVTAKKSGEKLSLFINADPADRADVWIDLNNDKKLDPGEKVNTFGLADYPVTVSQTITIYGKVHFLNCSDNQLNWLDVTKDPALVTLFANNNIFYTLDVSKNTALQDLTCWGNKLYALDVSKNTKLNWLWCNDNDLSTLDLSKNTALYTLDCSRNDLKSLNVSNNTDLGRFNCSENKLTLLDLSKNKSIYELDCSANQLTALDLSTIKVSGLSVSVSVQANQIKAYEMSALINSLPKPYFAGTPAYLFTEKPPAGYTEGNSLPGSGDVYIATQKNWSLYKYDAAGNKVKF